MKKATALLIIIVTVLFACTKQGSVEGSLRPALGGKYYGGIYRTNEVGELSSMDPPRINDVTSSHIALNIYDNLLAFDANLDLQPELAREWEISADGMRYTYHLRTDVFFHDNPCFPNSKGRRLVAADVLYSLTRVCDARIGTKSSAYFVGKVKGAAQYFEATRVAFESGSEPSIKGVEGLVVVNDSTFVIELSQPFAPFENYVALSSMGIYPREAVTMYGKDFSEHPVGTGPFSFVQWIPDRLLVLRRNPKYWKFDSAGNHLPLLDGVRFSFIKDDKLQLLEFTAGKLEESYRIANEFFGDIVDENKKPKGKYRKFTLLHVPALSTQYYGFLTIDPLFKDKRIRQAFNMAVDRRRIIRYVLRGQAAGPAEHGLVPSSMPNYPYDSVRGYQYNPEKARQLLAEAGYPDGRGFPSITLQLNAGGGRNVSIAEAIQSMLKEVLNIDCKLLQVEFAQHLESIDGGHAPFYRLGWIADYPDPESFLNLFYGKLVPKHGGISPINSVRYMNPRFDEVFERAIVTTVRTERMNLYREAEQIAIDDAPMLLIIHDEDYRFVQPYVRDYPNNAMDQLKLHAVWFDKTPD
ncbi:MAG: ABC transporter substrate-binding protein [Ignavibacteria bacterium]|nr:ABC transporter substrate-binding protein [Ignavibacteria bacterium]